MGQKTAVLETPAGPLTFTIADAQEMRGALRKYLEGSVREGEIPFLNRESGAWITEGTPGVIDSAGVVRVGYWVLEDTRTGIALVFRVRATATTQGYALYAPLERVSGAWTVSDLYYEQLFRR